MIKQYILRFLFFIPITFCFLGASTNYKNVKKTQLRDSIVPKFDLNYIKSKTIKLEKEVEVNGQFCNNYNMMPKDFSSYFLIPKKIVLGDSQHLDPTDSNGFCFKQYKEFKTFNLFTFTYENGYCCKTLYAVTLKKNSLEVINIGVLAFSGNENGWIGDKYGTWTTDWSIDMLTISNYDDDFVEENNNSRIDSTWSTIKINQQGFLKEEVYKSVRYLEGRKID